MPQCRDGCACSQQESLNGTAAPVQNRRQPAVGYFPHFEITMLLIDKEFARDVEVMLEQDFANSRRASATEYTEASLWFRLAVRVARLLAPIQ